MIYSTMIYEEQLYFELEYSLVLLNSRMNHTHGNIKWLVQFWRNLCMNVPKIKVTKLEAYCFMLTGIISYARAHFLGPFFHEYRQTAYTIVSWPNPKPIQA